jgi:hypothetical protein
MNRFFFFFPAFYLFFFLVACAVYGRYFFMRVHLEKYRSFFSREVVARWISFSALSLFVFCCLLMPALGYFVYQESFNFGFSCVLIFLAMSYFLTSAASLRFVYRKTLYHEFKHDDENDDFMEAHMSLKDFL